MSLLPVRQDLDELRGLIVCLYLVLFLIFQPQYCNDN